MDIYDKYMPHEDQNRAYWLGALIFLLVDGLILYLVLSP